MKKPEQTHHTSSGEESEIRGEGAEFQIGDQGAAAGAEKDAMAGVSGRSARRGSNAEDNDAAGKGAKSSGRRGKGANNAKTHKSGRSSRKGAKVFGPFKRPSENTEGGPKNPSLDADGVLRKPQNKTGGWFKKHFGRFISPAFLLMLVLSFGMWYMIKLSSNYVADIEVRVDIDGHGLLVSCVAEGKGTDLLSRRRSRKPIQLQWSDLEVSPSEVNPENIVVSPSSLQNAISIRCPDIKIISVGAIPEIRL